MIFFRNIVSEQDSRVVYFDAIDNEDILGSCTLVLGEKFAEVTKLNFNEKALFVAEGLLKSAYNYAVLKNYYMAKCTVSGFDSLLNKLGFEFKDGEYINDIPTILTGSCKSCSDK